MLFTLLARLALEGTRLCGIQEEPTTIHDCKRICIENGCAGFTYFPNHTCTLFASIRGAKLVEGTCTDSYLFMGNERCNYDYGPFGCATRTAASYANLIVNTVSHTEPNVIESIPRLAQAVRTQSTIPSTKATFIENIAPLPETFRTSAITAIPPTKTAFLESATSSNHAAHTESTILLTEVTTIESTAQHTKTTISDGATVSRSRHDFEGGNDGTVVDDTSRINNNSSTGTGGFHPESAYSANITRAADATERNGITSHQENVPGRDGASGKGDVLDEQFSLSGKVRTPSDITAPSNRNIDEGSVAPSIISTPEGVGMSGTVTVISTVSDTGLTSDVSIRQETGALDEVNVPDNVSAANGTTTLTSTSTAGEMSALGESTTSGSVSATDEISTPSAIGSFEKSSGFYERRVPGDSIAVNDSITPSSISTTEHRGVSEENTVPGNASTENTSETSNISTSEKSDFAKEVNIPTTGTTVDDTGVPYDTSTLERGSVLSEVAALSKASVDDASTPSNVSASKKSEVNVEDIAHDNTSVINDTRTLNKTNVPQEDTVIGQLPTNASIPEESAKPSVSGQLPTNASVPEGSAKPSVIGQLPTNASTPERSAKPSVIGQLPTNASIPEGSAKPSVIGQLPTDASIPEGSAKPSVIGQLPTNASISEGSAKPSIIGQLPTNASIPKGSAKPSDVSATAEVIDASTTTEPTTTANNITNISGTQPTPSNKTTPNKYSLVEGIKLNGSGIRRRGKKTKEECERLASLGSEAYMLTKNGTCITIGKVTAAYADPSQTYNTYVTKDVNVTKAVKDFRKKCPPNQYFTYNATSGDQKVIYTFIPMEIASYKKMGYRGEKGRYSSYYYRSKKCQQLCPKSHTFFVMSQQDLTNVIDAIQAYNRLSPAKNETLREYNMGFYFKKNNLSTWEDGTPYVNNIWPNFPSDIKGINSHSCVNLDITTGQPYLGNCYVEYDTVICERRCVSSKLLTSELQLFRNPSPSL
ncbi:unnamed protein product [Toxocara canis]|uniref:Apple domain-containing protein n=1 Tax=Toxocara canis TaxID=6265 RepID=A0A183VA35_TOXCA|nr:unnamed protein product [Toxocara canis]